MAIGKTTVADGYITMPEAKFAALIRHFGRKFTEDGEEHYILEFPLKDWATVPKGTRVLCADGATRGASVGFIAYTENPLVASTRDSNTGDC